MADRVTFSGENRTLIEIFDYYEDTEVALRAYFLGPVAPSKFPLFSLADLRLELHKRLAVHNEASALQILAALEAAFRVDYLKRVYGRKKDCLSKALREIHKVKGPRASLEHEIFEAWADNTTIGPLVIAELKAAFKYRHWLAHGQYWTPKLGRKYDYNRIATLAESVFNGFPFVD